MATLAALNAAITDTAMSSTEYNDNMTRIRAAINTIDAAQLNTNSVTTLKIVDANVTADKLADDSVTVNKIPDATITLAKLASATITSLQAKYVVVNATRNLTSASGDVSYTSFGGTPIAIIMIGALSGGGDPHSVGCSDATTNFCSYFNQGNISGTAAPDTTSCINLQTDAATRQSAVVKTFDSDGVTLTWTKQGSPSGTGSFTFLAAIQ